MTAVSFKYPLENFTLVWIFLHNQRLWWLWQIWSMPTATTAIISSRWSAITNSALLTRLKWARGLLVYNNNVYLAARYKRPEYYKKSGEKTPQLGEKLRRNQPGIHCSHMERGPKFVKKGTWFWVKRGPKGDLRQQKRGLNGDLKSIYLINWPKRANSLK